MKISYILQLQDFFIMLGIGILIGIFYGIINIINRIKYIYPIQIISDIIFSLVAVITLLILCNILNMGQIRLFLVIGYITGFIIERITLGKIFAKSYKYVYNKIVKIFIKSKFGRIIFK